MAPKALTIVALIAALLPSGAPRIASAAPEAAPSLAGLWHAKRRFGPDIRGTLLVTREGDDWQADIAGRKVPFHVTGSQITFELPGGNEGRFRGTLDATREDQPD